MKLYNTLTRKIEKLNPLQDNLVKLYTCGLTVYSQPHIGNWVSYIYWDLLVRVLEDAEYKVERVQNITDVGHLTSDDDSGEDKIEAGARREGVSAWDIAEKYIEIAEHEAYAMLRLKKPKVLARATDFIDQQISFVKELEEKGYTYEIPEEGIYFDTSQVKDYGKLAKLDIEGLQAGARVSVEGKRNITDFAVWKLSPKNQKRHMEWESPWGVGFPGWHLECSVIAREVLGDQIDIHTGGVDHIPVHHTNEIAQTEAYTEQSFAQVWLHNNHLKVDGNKMSKSLGNIFTLQDITDRNLDLDSFKLMILSKHYRTEGNFTWDNLQSYQNRLNALKNLASMRWQSAEDGGGVTAKDIQEHKDEVRQALQNDLNSSSALAVLSKLEKQVASFGVTKEAIEDFGKFIAWIDGIFGLQLSSEQDVSDTQKELLKKRSEARNQKDWQASDKLRDELRDSGITVRDASFGQVWERY